MEAANWPLLLFTINIPMQVTCQQAMRCLVELQRWPGRPDDRPPAPCRPQADGSGNVKLSRLPGRWVAVAIDTVCFQMRRTSLDAVPRQSTTLFLVSRSFDETKFISCEIRDTHLPTRCRRTCISLLNSTILS